MPSDARSRVSWLKRLGRWSDRMLLRRLPEYALFESEEQRLRAIEELDHELEKSDDFWRAMMALWVAAVICANASMCLIPMFIPWRFPGRMPLAIGLQVLIAFAATVWIWRRGIKRRLRDKLIQLRVPVCRRCGYNLRGLGSSTLRCPECGAETDEELRQAMRPVQ